MAQQVELFRILSTQHRALSDLLSKLAHAPQQSAALLPVLESQLLAHAKAEEQTLYAAIVLAGGKAARLEIDEFSREHQEMAQLLARLGTLDDDDDDEDWDEALETLTELVSSHVEEEEDDVFELARRVLDDDTLERLAEDFQALYEQELEALAAKADD